MSDQWKRANEIGKAIRVYLDGDPRLRDLDLAAITAIAGAVLQAVELVLAPMFQGLEQKIDEVPERLRQLIEAQTKTPVCVAQTGADQQCENAGTHLIGNGEWVCDEHF